MQFAQAAAIRLAWRVAYGVPEHPRARLPPTSASRGSPTRMRLLQGLANAGFSRQHQLRRGLKLPVRTTLLPRDLTPQGQHGLTLTAEFPSSNHLERPSNDRHIAVELRVLAQKSLDLVREERDLVFKRQFLERNHLELACQLAIQPAGSLRLQMRHGDQVAAERTSATIR